MSNSQLSRRFLFAIIVTALTSGCCDLNSSKHLSDLPLRYRNTQYGFDFYLPASWRGYSVSIQQLEDETYSVAEDKQVTVGQTPMITLRHPHWQASAPCQDIPILVFSREQWDALHHGNLWPSFYAGGTIDELWHDRRFVFGISSRYNADETLSGWREVAEIIERNRAANKMPRLYPE